MREEQRMGGGGHFRNTKAEAEPGLVSEPRSASYGQVNAQCTHTDR